jgi:sugar phosphate isomerase/epimerase
MAGLGPNDLVLCSGTIPAAGFRERVEAAAAGGFSAISLWGKDYAGARRDEGLSDADLRALLDDHGLEVAELDAVMPWSASPQIDLPGAEADDAATFFAFSEQDFFAVADAIGARSLNAVEISGEPIVLDAAAEVFAGLCDRAGEHGLLVHLEYLPWSSVPDAGTAWEIVRAADRPNGGVLVDSWHEFRNAAGDEQLREVPGEQIIAIQLNDAPAGAEADLVDETMHRRLVPGEGAIDLVGLVRLLDASGCRAPIGVEVFSDELNALPAAEVARRVGDATRAVLAAARAG